jgi:hypothetical protein
MILAARFGHICAQIRRIFYYSRPSDNRRETINRCGRVEPIRR